MLLALLVFFVILMILSIVIDNNTSVDSSYCDALFGISLVCGILTLVAVMIVAPITVSASKIEDKISLYEKENIVIETTITELAENYQTYEQETIDKVTNPEVLVQMYPDLKSSSLVNAQIQTYLENHKKIVKLKEELINRSVCRWWLYFGGE